MLSGFALNLVAALAVSAAPAAPAQAPSAQPTVKSIALPGSPGPVFMDYLAVEANPVRVWVPAGNTGNVDVLDVSTGQIATISGFPTATRRERTIGPSSVTIGEEAAFVGNRGDNSVCAIDRHSLKKGACVTLPSMPDGIAYIAATHEVWATTPRDQTLTLIDVKDVKAPKITGTIKLPGDPEGYAVDSAHGLFFTNLEDKDRTLTVDVKAHKILLDAPATCGKDGPRGLALDAERHVLFVACTDHVVAMDQAHGMKPLASLPTGAGVDNIDYLPGSATLFAAGGKEANLTVGKWNADGTWTVLGRVPTAERARVVVAAPNGTAFVADSSGGRLLGVSVK